jgi:hypothetical protein
MQQVRGMQQISSAHVIAQPASLLISLQSLYLIVLFFILSIWPAVTLAEVRVVTAQRMGDRDTREDAIRLATEAAKRNALEQVAVYLESITIVDGLDVTKDEIRDLYRRLGPCLRADRPGRRTGYRGHAEEIVQEYLQGMKIVERRE